MIALVRSALIVLCALALLSCEKREQPKQSIQNVSVRIVHSPEVRAFLSQIKESFLQLHPYLPDGSKLNIEFIQELGIPAAKELASGELKAEGWLVPSSALIDYTNSHLKDFGSRQVDCKKLFSSPVVIATLERHVDQFNATNGQFSWHGVFDTRMSQGPSEIPDTSYLAYSHGFPDSSVSGLSALLQLSYLATSRKKEMLSADSLKAEHIHSMLQRYEDLVSQYSMSEGFLLDRVAASGAKRVRFSITTEQQVIQFNRHRDPNSTKLVALYPEEGSTWQEYYFCSNGADWVGPAYRAVTKILTGFMSSSAAQQFAAQHGFRPSISPDLDWSKLAQSDAIQPNLPSQSFPPVAGTVVEYFMNEWKNLMRPAALLLVVDTSGSMEGDSLRAVKESLRNFLARLPARDKKGLMSFSSEPTLQVDFTTDNNVLFPKLESLQAVGGSAAYDAVKNAVSLMTAPELNPFRRTILMITDGEGNNSEISLQGVQDYINNKLSRYDINLMVIGIRGEGTNFADLERITRSANGTFQETSLEQLSTMIQEMMKNI